MLSLQTTKSSVRRASAMELKSGPVGFSRRYVYPVTMAEAVALVKHLGREFALDSWALQDVATAVSLAHGPPARTLLARATMEMKVVSGCMMDDD
jgi:hypothetical protein